MARNVDFFGLDSMGQPDGNPMWGAFVGTGLGTLAAIGVKQYMPRQAKHAEVIGMGAGVLGGAILWLAGHRASGITGAVSAVLNNGLRALEGYVFKSSAAMSGARGLRGVVIEPTQALGMVDVERTQALMGATSDNGGMPQLVGANLQSAADHIQLVGGPQLAQHSGAFGATVIGQGMN